MRIQMHKNGLHRTVINTSRKPCMTRLFEKHDPGKLFELSPIGASGVYDMLRARGEAWGARAQNALLGGQPSIHGISCHVAASTDNHDKSSSIPNDYDNFADLAIDSSCESKSVRQERPLRTRPRRPKKHSHQDKSRRGHNPVFIGIPAVYKARCPMARKRGNSDRAISTPTNPKCNKRQRPNHVSPDSVPNRKDAAWKRAEKKGIPKTASGAHSGPDRKRKTDCTHKRKHKEAITDRNHPGHNPNFDRSLLVPKAQYSKIYGNGLASIPKLHNSEKKLCGRYHLQGGCYFGIRCGLKDTHCQLAPSKKRELKEWSNNCKSKAGYTGYEVR